MGGWCLGFVWPSVHLSHSSFLHAHTQLGAGPPAVADHGRAGCRWRWQEHQRWRHWATASPDAGSGGGGGAGTRDGDGGGGGGASAGGRGRRDGQDRGGAGTCVRGPCVLDDEAIGPLFSTSTPAALRSHKYANPIAQDEMAAARATAQQGDRALSRPCRRLGLLSLRDRRLAEAAVMPFAQVCQQSRCLFRFRLASNHLHLVITPTDPPRRGARGGVAGAPPRRDGGYGRLHAHLRDGRAADGPERGRLLQLQLQRWVYMQFVCL